MKRFLFMLFALLLAATGAIYAQNGEIQGKVTDAKTGETVPFATVQLTVNGSLQAAQTDFDGYYSIKPLPAGAYDVKVTYVGYADQETRGVIVNSDKITFLDVKLSLDSEILEEVEIKAYKVPLMQADQTSTGSTVTKEEIVNLPTRSVNSIAANTAGVYQKDEGGGINVKGSRSDATDVYIDGIKVRGGSNLPQSSIEQLTVVTGGVPARYGDATGGIINITTRGPSSKFAGGLELATSKFLDNYGYYLGNFNVSGPILKIKKGTDKERTLMGFFLSGEYTHEDDDDPSYVGIWKAKDDVLAAMRENPLTANGIDTARFMTFDQLENVPNRPNMAKNEYSGAGKIDIQPVQGLNFTLGGTYNYSTGGISRALYSREYHRRFEMFNSDHTPKYEFNDYRGYLRITQRLGAQKEGAAENADKKLKPSALQNAYYSLQFDYSKTREKSYDPIFKNDPFAYGYVGQFASTYVPSYLLRSGDITIPGTATPLTGYYLSTYTSDDIAFTPNGGNADLENYVKDFYALGNPIKNLDDLNYRNGTLASSNEAVYSLYYTPGRVHDVIFNRNNDQYRLTFNGSFDLKPTGASERNKHAIEFGFEYEQRMDRFYNLNPQALWNLMDTRIGRFGSGINFDVANPILVIDGNRYTLQEYEALQQSGSSIVFDAQDTITYNLIQTSQTYFDKKFREKFGYNATDFVEPWSKTAADYTLDMFSPTELLVNGGTSSLVDYSGYDYLGNVLSTQPAFEDFWTAKDENGEYTRPQGAFRPVYMAGFIQDKFAFKDLIFNIGVRVDRFDANQKVPKDKYSPLYAVKSAGEVSNLGAHPSNVNDDFVVYVNDGDNPSKITGYRDGDQWYSESGSTVDDPSKLGSSLYPYYVEGQAQSTQSEDYNPNLAFEDYKPQVTVMPRIAFSFQISDEAIFFAHYDILTQRPQGRMVALPSDYYFFEAATQLLLNNPNLRPERTIDYQIGFKQKLGQTSAISLSGFYREMKDMLQVIAVKNAIITRGSTPSSYNTYGNVDFGTVKGLELSYDLRRTKNVRMTFTYTLQYAEGTGSGDRSQENLVSNSRPNLRTIFPLSYDSRHLLNVSFDYRYGEGAEYDGPKLFGKDIFANLGLNVILRGRSGEPYSRQENAAPSAKFGVQSRNDIEGTFNGSRLPFNFRTDLRLDKDFKLNVGKAEGKTDRYLSVYFLVQNLLNTENVTGVYAYTGRADDDGYLTSSAGATSIEVTNTADNLGFIDQYTTKVVNPDNFSLPRRMRLGLIFNF